MEAVAETEHDHAPALLPTDGAHEGLTALSVLPVELMEVGHDRLLLVLARLVIIHRDELPFQRPPLRLRTMQHSHRGALDKRK